MSKKVLEFIGCAMFMVGFGGLAGLTDSNGNVFGFIFAICLMALGTIFMYRDQFDSKNRNSKYRDFDKDIFDLSA